MKFLLATARNHHIFINAADRDEPITTNTVIRREPVIEMILSVFERQTQLVSGCLVPMKAVETIRINMDIDGAESLVTSLNEWIAEAEILQERLKTCSPEN